MMPAESKTIAALQTAIQMEIDGKIFYLKASQESRHELGQHLLATLAYEEDKHREKFEKIYESLRQKRGWAAVPLKATSNNNLRNIFAKAVMENAGSGSASEMEAVKTALDMEKASYDFYQNQAGLATESDQREFFQSIAGEESVHSLLLVDYYEYLQDPEGWFTNKEHHSLDGA
jgi:rubrerythrin